MTDLDLAWARESALLRLPDGAPAVFSPDWAFGSSTGRQVRVAVIDSGIEADHPALGGAVDTAAGAAFHADDNGTVQARFGPHDDVYGHGTACAGIIHALAPEASIVSVRVLDDKLRGAAAAFHAGLAWAVDQGFDVINLSLGAGRREWALAFHDLCDRGYFANSFIVTAANNVARDSFPSLFASVTSVAANNATDPLRFHFNPEPPTEFLARGVNVEVPWRDGSTIVTTGNSFAAPHIAAFAALIRSQHPELRPFQIKTALWASAANVREAIRAHPRSLSSLPGSLASPPISLVEDEQAQVEALMTAYPLAHYEVGPLTARSPWGPVFAARGRGMAVTLHRLDAALVHDAVTRNRFLATLRLVSTLDHPHLLPILDVVEGQGMVVVAAPSCPASLADQGPLAAPTAVAAVLSALSGLHHAHTIGVLHGDLRPDNARLSTEGRVVLADVGLAAALTSDVRTTSAPTDPGSWAYLAPEQLDGEAVGAFTDTHAAGLLLFQLLSGALPHPPAPNLGALVTQRAAPQPRSLAELSPEAPGPLVAVADRAVADRPADRYPSAAAMAAALSRAAEASFGPDWSRTQPLALTPIPKGR